MTLPVQVSPRVAALLKETKSPVMHRARLALVLDATGSRQPGWDQATHLQTEMLEAAAAIGTLDVQLVHFGGDRMRKTEWFSDPYQLVEYMRRIRCSAGLTQYQKAFAQVHTENAREKIAACVIIGDAIEEHPNDLYRAATTLGMPLFAFQEDKGICTDENGNSRCDDHGLITVEKVFRELARLSNGAYGEFNSSSARQLSELLRAVAVFAVGGIAALTNQHTEGAQKLLGQLRRTS
jgi:hypothetical protein